MDHAHGCTQRHPHPETGYRSALLSIRSTCALHVPGEHTFDFLRRSFLNADLAQIRAFLNYALFHRYGSVLWRRRTSALYLPFHCILLCYSDRVVSYREWLSYGTLTLHWPSLAHRFDPHRCVFSCSVLHPCWPCWIHASARGHDDLSVRGNYRDLGVQWAFESSWQSWTPLASSVTSGETRRPGCYTLCLRTQMATWRCHGWGARGAGRDGYRLLQRTEQLAWPAAASVASALAAITGEAFLYGRWAPCGAGASSTRSCVSKSSCNGSWCGYLCGRAAA